MKTPPALITLAAALALAAGALAMPGAGAPGGSAAAPLKGEVLEVKDAGPYTYLRLKTGQGEAWAAITSTPVKKGAQVTIANPMVMENFESKALKKTFDRIVFGTIADPNAAAAPPATAATMPSPHGATGGPKPGPTTAPVTKVARATGADARTVEELNLGKAKLKDRSVTLRAQVVKVNNGIMGKNWLHVQDGSGSAGAGTHDMLVTSKETATVGDVVSIRGTVRTDVKLGSGYEYAVLIEDATLRR